MRTGTKPLLLAFVLTVIIALPLASHPTPLNTQQLICCNMLLNVNGNWIGASRHCDDYMRNGPREVRTSICRQLRQGGGVCTELAQYCSPEDRKPPDIKCEKPTPWFDTSDCPDVQKTLLKIDKRSASVNITMCGSVVGSFWLPRNSGPEVWERIRAENEPYWPRQVCCTKFRQAVRSGMPCNPRKDLDCDGKPNDADNRPEEYRIPADASIDRFPPNFNVLDPDFLPHSTGRASKGVGDCPCKWELVTGKLICSPDGKQPHEYRATFRCPSTKAEVSTVKTAPATAPCK
jgi:hypothetical protein